MIDFAAIRADAEALQPEAIELRRDFHRHPELGFEEVRTAGIVAEYLSELRLEVTTGVGQTGVVGLLRGGQPGATVLVRADMDALPIHELNRAEYASKTDGVMHACGHDGHTTIGLMTAKLLSARRSELKGNVKFAFQPAEEILGGAKAMIADGVLEEPRVMAAFGLHLWSGSPIGTVSSLAPAIMAGADVLTIVVEGKGGHAAMPHYTVDSIVVASQIVSALQTVVSRNVSPLDSAVVSFGMIHGGTALNVIPEQVELRGTIRSFKDDVRKSVIERVHAVAEGIAAGFGATAHVKIEQVCSPTINDEFITDLVLDTAKELFGETAVVPTNGVMGSEDMSFFLREVPGCFFFVGAQPTDAPTYPHHNPYFDFNEDVMPIGAALMTASVMRYLRGDSFTS